MPDSGPFSDTEDPGLQRNSTRTRSWRKKGNNVSRRTYLLVAGVLLVSFGVGLRYFTSTLAWMHPSSFYTDEPLEVLGLGSVQWFHCREAHVDGAECGVAVVPLDYTNPDAGTANIALGRYKATSSPRKGMVMVNPGGPGMSGTQLASELGSYMHAIIGDDWDIVGFDPRGTGKSYPRISCFGRPSLYQLFKANTVLERGPELGSQMTDPAAQKQLLRYISETDILVQSQYGLCSHSTANDLRYVGTAYVAKDIDYITTLLEGKDALINYHGASYGTVIGQHLINMFPDRIGRVVLDGVVDASMWTTTPIHKWFRQMLTSAEDAFTRFTSSCADAGPEHCDLSHQKGESRETMASRMQTLLDTLYDHPVAGLAGQRAGVLTSSLARNFIFSALVRPRRWPAAAEALSAALNGDVGPILSSIMLRQAFVSDLETEAITCADSTTSGTPPIPFDDVLAEYTHVFTNVSRFGLAHPTVAGAACERWNITPSERYTGPWDHKPRNSILIVSNAADPVTPLSAAKHVNERMKDWSGLVVQNSAGHTSHAVASLCTARHTRAYFATGVLPLIGAICEPDERPFMEDSDVNPALSDEDKETLRKLIAFDNGLHGVNLDNLVRRQWLRTKGAQKVEG